MYERIDVLSQVRERVNDRVSYPAQHVVVLFGLQMQADKRRAVGGTVYFGPNTCRFAVNHGGQAQ
jgi:hypothetical protein